MTGTARISAALIEIGVLGAGQTAPGPLAVLGLEHLQRLVGSWGAIRSLQAVLLRTTKTLTLGTRDYTIGSGGAINIVRPSKIERAGFIMDSTVPDPIEWPIHVLTDQEWAEEAMKTLDGPTIAGVYFDQVFSSTERGTISTIPTIDHANTQLVLYTPLALVGYAALSDDLVFPPGVDDALHYSLASRLCNPLGKSLTAEQREFLSNAMTALKTVNARPVELRIPANVPGVTTRPAGSGGAGIDRRWWGAS